MSEFSGIRLIGHYLPQFHPIPENDEWWGSGFTEWTNVANAKPLFSGHHQPNIPADLGFYDLRVPETRAAQADLARRYGLEGFCYWHYWFGNGRRILERPFAEVLSSGEPDFPFCLAWANQTWTGIWHGSPDRILVEQEYPGAKDYEAHFFELLPAFTDDRYIKVHGKPLFLVFRPTELPDATEFSDTWRRLAHEAGLEGLYLVGMVGTRQNEWNALRDGFDASALRSSLEPALAAAINPRLVAPGAMLRRAEKAVRRRIGAHRKGPYRIEYSAALKLAITDLSSDSLRFPTLLSNWDNTPRSGRDGVVMTNSTPELFRKHALEIFQQVAHREQEERIVFLKSWNEWAEGNYVEPDQRFGRGYLEVLGSELLR